MAAAGAWIGEQVFGNLAAALGERLEPPATVVRLVVPKAAQRLLRRPLELAHLPVGGDRAHPGADRAAVAAPSDSGMNARRSGVPATEQRRMNPA